MPRKTSVVCAFVVTVLCALCTTVQARLGETREQCDKRYGKVVSVMPGVEPVESVGGGVKTVQNGRFENRVVFRGIHAGSMRSFMR